MSVIEAVTVTLYRGRKGKLRRRASLAYRDAAWGKMHARRRCIVDLGGGEREPRYSPCRYHDPRFRVSGGGPESEPEFHAPHIWGLPRSDRWDYGRAVAFRLARFYRYLDSKAQP